MGTSDPRRRLRIYLNDHRAGAAGGVSLARRCLGSNEGSALGTELERLVADLEADTRVLDDILRRFSFASDPFKRLAAWASERVGRLKPNGQVSGYSPLSRLIELELLLAGIDAKRSLWRSLGTISAPELAGLDFESLVNRATDQRRRLTPFHEQASGRAFAGELSDVE
jgi:hypothetical protein